MSDLVSKLRLLKLFDALPDSEVAALSKKSHWEVYGVDQEVFAAGAEAKRIFIVAYGAIKLFRRLESGSEIVLGFIPKDGIVAAVVALKENSVYPVSAAALEETGLIRIDREDFREVFQKHPVLGPRLLAMVAERMGTLQTEKTLIKSKMQKRIADFLLRTLEGQPKTFGDRIMLRLTRQDIANHLGTTVETVIRVLSAWTKQEIIETTDQRIDVLNRQALKKIIESEDQD